MSEDTKQQMFAMTPIWLWPVLWLSLRSYERWLHAYWSKHGFCEVICRLSRFGTVHVHKIYPPEPEQISLTGAHISRFEHRIYAEVLTPDIVISQPVRSVCENASEAAWAACEHLDPAQCSERREHPP